MKPSVGEVMAAVHTYTNTLLSANREDPEWWTRQEKSPVDTAIVNVRRMVERLSDGEHESWYCTCPEPEWWLDERSDGAPWKACEICGKGQSEADAVRAYEDAMSAAADDTVKASRE
jgi:hypothetical protein